MTNTDSDSPTQQQANHNSDVEEPVKKKRGRPRKYNDDGSLRVTSSATTSSPSGLSLSHCSSSPYIYYLDEGSRGGSSRGRGRGHGRGGPRDLQVLANLGGDFTPHIVTVDAGEDIIGKMMSQFQRGPREVCVLSANGTVSNVTIKQLGFSEGVQTFEGLLELLSMSGSFTIKEVDNMLTRSGELSVLLAGPEGRVIGGALVGSLIAESSIQMVVGSFTPNTYTNKRKYARGNLSSVTETAALDSVSEATRVQQATQSDGTTFNFLSSSIQQQSDETSDRSASNDR